MNKALVTGIAMSGMVLMASESANATLLAPGESIFLAGTTVALQPELAGTVILDDVNYAGVSPSGNGAFQVGFDITNRVIRSNFDNSLIFSPRIESVLNNTSGNFLVDRVVVNGFTDFFLDVDYRTDGLGDRGPTTSSRSADGDQLTFDFFFPLLVSNLFANPQEDSYFFSINSNATAYTTTGSLSIFGRHLSYPGETFEVSYTGLAVPTADNVAEVSEPGSLALHLTSLACLLGCTRSRRNKHLRKNIPA